MKVFKLLIIILVLVLSNFAISQETYVHQDTRIDSLVKLHKTINSIDSLVPGYRVQIFFESGNYSKAEALKTASEFAEEYPDIRHYLSFDEPYYRIRVGDFRTLIEAKGFLNKIIKSYPSAFEVKDRIYFPGMPQ